MLSPRIPPCSHSRVDSIDWAPSSTITGRSISAIASNGEVHQRRATERLEERRDNRVGESSEEIDVREQGGLDLAGHGVEERLLQETEVAVGGGAETRESGD